MKKLLYILIFTSLNVFSQEIVRPATSYYSADSIKNRTDLSRALADAVKKWSDSSFKEMEVDIYQPTLKFRLPKIYFQKPLAKYTRDTLIMGVIANVINENGKKRYGYFYSKKNNQSAIVKVLPLDSLYSTVCNECKLKSHIMPLNLRISYEGKYAVNFQEYKDTTFKALNFVRYQDSTKTRVQKYANGMWSYWKRESNSLDELYRRKFEFISNSPGDGTGDSGVENVDWNTIRRHSQTHYTKFWQILAIRQDGYGLVMKVEENPLK